MRADEHEGDLGSTEEKRLGDQVSKYARKILVSDARELSENPIFLRWFQKYAYPALMQDFPVNNGSSLAEFMGRRQLVIQIKNDMESAVPGFLIRVLHARDQYETELRQVAQKEQ